MASRAVPTSRIRLGFHLCGQGLFYQVSGYQWPFIFSGDEFGTPGQYVPVPTNAEKTLVSSFGQSAFFDFAAGTNFAGGIRVRMAQFPYNYGEVKIPDSSYHDFYLSPPYNSNTTSVIGRHDIYWDYDTNYPGGFQIMVNSGALSGFYRGISDRSDLTGTQQTLFKINGHGPDGTTNTDYWADGGSVGDLLIEIPWADINAVNDIYVYFAEPIVTTTTAAPTTTTTAAPATWYVWNSSANYVSDPGCFVAFSSQRGVSKATGNTNFYPEVGDIVYSGTDPLSPGRVMGVGWYLDTTNFVRLNVTSGGLVSSITLC